MSQFSIGPNKREENFWTEINDICVRIFLYASNTGLNPLYVKGYRKEVSEMDQFD